MRDDLADEERPRAGRLRSHLRGGLRGVSLRRELVARVPFSHDAGRRAAHALLFRAKRPTAVACGNDVLTLGVLSAARERGVAVPEELTVVGLDDIPMAGWPLVALTTVHGDLDALA